ncbi:GNAT family N-acetyltransferase [Candidatus Enterococcus willemsii]|uniref:Acetyltransferase n=1 Tax=Candidatus Enterococcus willemsii TaxID=1857215 RepID=A0ABQ6YZB3_9ENTE|nr:N-acetyltransferase [Enterococcus sp. CU12B]KAF1303788.1 acetyltransferase [Enterococcus sp. CU12B]
MYQLKKISSNDYKQVDELIHQAFEKSDHGYTGEAELVRKLREEANYSKELEYIAIQDNQIIGHGLLSEVTLYSENTELIGLCLAPLCVLPDYQGNGVGKALLTALEKQASDYPFISILGDPTYYTRFGYQIAAKFHIEAPFPVPTEAYLIKELHPASLANVSGTISYPSAFN